MLRSLIVVALLTGTAHGAIRECHVFNSTDHAIGWIEPGASWWILPGTYKTLDGSQLLSIDCAAKTPVLNLVGSRGSVTIEKFPAWFEPRVDNDTVTVKAATKGATVEIDGVPLKLTKGVGVQKLDTGAMILARDPALTFDPKDSSWHVFVTVKATSADEKVELVMRVDASPAANVLMADLRSVETRPVAWAAEPDRAGQLVAMDSQRSGWRTRDYSHCGFDTFTSIGGVSAVSALSRVAICTVTLAKVDTCPASKDPFAKNEPPVERYRSDATIRVFEAKTSKLIASTTLKGAAPAACRDSAAGRIVGEHVPTRTMVAWLKSVE